MTEPNDRASRFPISRHDDLDEMKADEYRYWQQQPSHVRLKATSDMAREAYRLEEAPAHVRRLQRTLVRIER